MCVPFTHCENDSPVRFLLDQGKILAQRVVPVLPSDNADAVAAKVLAQEHAVYPFAAAALCAGRVVFRKGDDVPVIIDETGVAT